MFSSDSSSEANSLGEVVHVALFSHCDPSSPGTISLGVASCHPGGHFGRVAVGDCQGTASGARPAGAAPALRLPDAQQLAGERGGARGGRRRQSPHIIANPPPPPDPYSAVPQSRARFLRCLHCSSHCCSLLFPLFVCVVMRCMCMPCPPLRSVRARVLICCSAGRRRPPLARHHRVPPTAAAHSLGPKGGTP